MSFFGNNEIKLLLCTERQIKTINFREVFTRTGFHRISTIFIQNKQVIILIKLTLFCCKGFKSNLESDKFYSRRNNCMKCLKKRTNYHLGEPLFRQNGRQNLNVIK